MPDDSAADAQRDWYRAELARGTERFFEPPRKDCPWCGSRALKKHLVTPDLLQHKPGRFRLDRCGDCGHVFQNPRLSLEGLAFYYRDFYDGLGAKRMERIFAANTRAYIDRARAGRPYFAMPASWLDVGTGHGHFCETAKSVFPGTRFDGLDLSDGVELARNAGRIENGYRGLFPELAPELAGQYDVVSLFHYLEHSLDPKRELEAARTVLKPCGVLVIEVPDPECRFAGWLGRWWGPWLQPQHLHFVPLANLRQHLTELGFQIHAVEHAEPHIPVDLVTAVWQWLNAMSQEQDVPWRPKRSLAAKLWRKVLAVPGIPLLLVALAIDQLVIRPLTGRFRFSNSYRVVARRRPT